jgi:hypothetical protein
MWALILPLSFVALLLPASAEAKVYRCEGAGGTTILTDQPKGKRGCVVMNTASPSPPGGYTPPPEDDPIQPVPTELPAAAMPPSTSLMQPRQAVSGDQPTPQSQASADPQAQAAPEAQHCSPRVNPLNPFAGLNCSPASGTDETKKP